jgi:type I restriction enzyme R subunit
MPSTTSNTEWLPRRKLFDPKLVASGWMAVPFDASCPSSTIDRWAVLEHPTDEGPTDYALFVGSRILGLVEVKKLSFGPQDILIKAARYYGGYGPYAHFAAFTCQSGDSTDGELNWYYDIRYYDIRHLNIRSCYGGHTE